MRLLILTAAIAAFSFPAFAQQQRQPPQRQPPPQQAQPQQPAPPPPGMFACRTEQETCFVAIVLGANQVSILYQNDPKAPEGIENKPIAVLAPSGAPAELGQHNGKVVMLIGEYTAQGLTKAEVVDVATPLLSFAIKSMLSAGEEEEPEPEPPPQRGRQPQRR
jgi:hypothetical protein